MSNANSDRSLADALAEIRGLRERVSRLEALSDGYDRLPRTALLSDKFLTRALAVFGHNFVVGLMIAVPFWLMMLVMVILISAAR